MLQEVEYHLRNIDYAVPSTGCAKDTSSPGWDTVVYHVQEIVRVPSAEHTVHATSGEGGQLVGERGGIAPEVVTSAFVQKGAQCRPNVDEGVS